ncbi:MAG: hypothetical protein V2A74_10375, partial [bacterium]
MQDKLLIFLFLFFLSCALIAPPTPCAAQSVTTLPLQQLGLGTLEAAAYSPDGKKIATAGGGGAFLWDVETAQVIRRFSGHSGIVSSVALSPDGTKVLTGSKDNT